MSEKQPLGSKQGGGLRFANPPYEDLQFGLRLLKMSFVPFGGVPERSERNQVGARDVIEQRVKPAMATLRIG